MSIINSAILYLNDIDKENGAFKIIPKSHKVNSQRIKREYIYSISNDIEKNIISLEKQKKISNNNECNHTL